MPWVGHFTSKFVHSQGKEARKVFRMPADRCSGAPLLASLPEGHATTLEKWTPLHFAAACGQACPRHGYFGSDRLTSRPRKSVDSFGGFKKKSHGSTQPRGAGVRGGAAPRGRGRPARRPQDGCRVASIAFEACDRSGDFTCADRRAYLPTR